MASKRDTVFIRRSMSFNYEWSAPMLAQLTSLLLTPSLLLDEHLKDFEARYSEGHKQLVFLPLALQLNLQVFDESTRFRYYADFAQDYGDSVGVLATLGWMLIANDYENVIRDSARLIMDEWPKHGSPRLFWPAFRMVGCQEGRDKVWTVRWQLENSSAVLETHQRRGEAIRLTVVQN